MKKFVIVALCIAMLLLGCSGNANTQATANAGSGNGNTGASGNASVGGSGNSGANAGASAGAGTSALGQFTALMDLESNAQWKADYDINTTIGTQHSTMALTQYLKGTSKVRTDVTVSGIQTQSYVIDGTIYSCANVNSAWACYKVSNQTFDAVTQAKADLQKDPSKYTIVADGTMQVAGTTANCFKVSGVQDYDMRTCYSDAGVLLNYKVTGVQQGQSFAYEMTAKDYSASVTDSDFVLPAAAQDIGSMMNGFGAGIGANASASVGGSGVSGDAGAGASVGSGTGYGAGSMCEYCSYLTGDQKAQCLASCGNSGSG